ncbi:hypothetical protein [Flavimarina sp. Hel_I_48]|uniref:hypothetical protein n=1 Tax=Flavimarina sp. Hel_I_48 TaxID=1392488 RepID=UPI0004DF65D9|nr:hypothetical protein [Flavimarina sp. Hel_I_48]
MQHEKIILNFLVLFPLGLPIKTQAQNSIGIGTTTPRTTLEVAGGMVVSGTLDIKEKRDMLDSDNSTFLIQNDIDEIKTLDVSNPTGAALGYIQKYIITNPNGDWVKDFDTGVNASEFVLISISAFFDRELVITGANSGENGSAPYTSAFIKNGTWHLIADFPSVTNRNQNEVGTWTFTTLIYSNDLSKQFGTVIIPMQNASTGAAPNAVID